MIRLNVNLVLSLLLIFVVVSWTLFSPCHADNFMEGFGKGSPGNANSTLTLAAERTHRVDPSNDFKYYDGGWDITNSHYLLSVAFSGAAFAAIGVIWFVIVALCFTIIACVCCCCCRKRKSRTDYSRKTYTISFIFLSLFLIMTIIGGAFLYNGLEKFQATARDVSDVLVSRANTVVDIIHNTLSDLAAAKNIQVSSFTLPDEIKQGIEKAELFNNQTAFIKSQAEETAKISIELLDAVSYSLIVVGTTMLLLTTIGFIISIFGWRVIVYILLLIGWILVTCTFILSGVTLIVHNGVADTCVAMEEWVQHPLNHTALSKLLPCMDETAAQKTLDITKNTSSQVVTLVNAFLTNIANKDMRPQQDRDIYYNQSGPSIPPLCNPFYPNMTERPCPPSEVDLKGAQTAYENFICDTSPTGVCITMGRLTPSLYSKVMVATNLSNTLHLNGPLLARLVDCSFVVDTFAEISKTGCPPFRRYSNQVFICLVLVSVAVMFSVILWVVFVRERRLQISSKSLKRTHVGS
ncbi:hypothetical protein Fmac_012625 [Flemingia macrophylla]|uniref:Uncharacterized protein n=1 Tax=Flemingia macrophylla TaxID=520843 RepID=A0ABD1MQV1_9FABA